MSADQKPVGIDAIRGTGYKSTVILAMLDLQSGSFLRLYNENLIYLISQNLI